MTLIPVKTKARLLQGNEACVEGAIAAGCRFFAGYPITPSSEIAELMAEKLPRLGGKFIQMEDEIASMAAIIGASLTGVKSLTATSGPGFSLKQENLGYASYTEIPCVVVNVQRVGPSTGQPTAPAQGDMMQVRWGTHGDHPVIALYPSTVRETFELTVDAFNLSERFRTPVILLMDEVVGHMREKVELPAQEEILIVNRPGPTVPRGEYLPYDDTRGLVPPMAAFGEGYCFHVTGLAHNRRGYPTTKPQDIDALIRRIHQKIEVGRGDIVRVEQLLTEDAEIGVFAYGSTARSAARAVRLARSRGIKVGLLRPITIWPFPDEAVKTLASRVRRLIVAEMNLGQMAGEVTRAAEGRTAIEGVFRVDGELITPEEILKKIEEVV
ncbi:MAG: 2-oxoacid:acceptor oxidoreductase subunit alpha [Firmicutes bacterium]|nr:2-oxoacid:acceptor oxidoreductase subunit alpha [Bacillota bacterium]